MNPLRPVGRLAYFALLLVAGGLVIGVQLDRQSLKDPHLAPMVPAPLRAEAQERLVEIRYAAGDGPGAYDEARLLVARRPLPAHHLVLLGSAAALDGDADAALAAMELSASRGWRDPVPQVLVAQAALLSGNAGVAADRLTALLAQGVATETVEPLLARALATPDGRRAFAERLAGPGYWHAAFLRLAPTVARPDEFAEVIALARQQGAAPDCNRLRAVAAAFRRAGNAPAAAVLEGGNCAGG